MQNCAFGSGTMANTSGTHTGMNSGVGAMLDEYNTITYATDVSPYVDGDNGNFRLAIDAAKNVGRGSFLMGNYSGTTTSAMDIGAAQVLYDGGIVPSQVQII